MPAVLFDLDGTLIDLFDLHLRGFQEVISRDYGLTFEAGDLRPYYGRTADEIARAFFEKNGVSDVDYPALVASRRVCVLGNLGSCQLLPGALSLLNELRDAGCTFETESYPNPEQGQRLALVTLSSTSGLA